MNIKQKIKISGRFMLEKVKSDGTVTEVVPWKDNLILDSWLDGLTGNSSIRTIAYCAVGTGNSTPVKTQTQLDNQIGSTVFRDSSSSSSSGSSPWFTERTQVFTFPLGQFNGDNLSEIGIGQLGNPSPELYTRALINPTVTILSDEQLRVTYTVRMDIPETDNVVVADGYTFTVRPYNVDSTSSWSISGASDINSSTSWGVSSSTALGSITTGLGSASSSNISDSRTTSYPDSRTVKTEAVWGISQANFSIAHIAFLYTGGINLGFKASVSPEITKTSADILEIDFSFEIGST